MYCYQQEESVYLNTQGMSVIASQNIDQGQFVAQYAGEMLTNSEADRRLAEYDATRAGVGHALMVSHAAASLHACIFLLQRGSGLCRNAFAIFRPIQVVSRDQILEHHYAEQVVRETLPSGTACLRFNIDATCIGNVARFFNHR